MKSRVTQPVRQRRRRPTGETGWSDARRKKSGAAYFDYNLLIVVIFLVCFGLVMLYSSSSYSAQIKFGDDMFYLKRQAFVTVGSFFAMYVVSRIDYHIYAKWAWPVYWIAMFLMALVRFSPLGVESYGSRRWLQMPFNMTLQPSEIMKIAIILLIPYLLCEMGKQAYSLKGIAKVAVWGIFAFVGVYYFTDNLSTALIVLLITCIMIFVVHPKTAPFLVLGGGGIAALMIILQIMAANVQNTTNFRLRRILAWLKPDQYATEESHQVTQALYAIGSGGFFGKGLGNSSQKMIIPEAQNDMILSVICEELGVFGVIVVLLLFGFLLYRLVFIARNAPDIYGSLIATGIFAHIALQVILNIGVVTRILPTTGITLPFISYGGTSILFLMAEMGIALGISTKIKINDE